VVRKKKANTDHFDVHLYFTNIMAVIKDMKEENKAVIRETNENLQASVESKFVRFEDKIDNLRDKIKTVKTEIKGEIELEIKNMRM
jgi:uncharacterized protein YdcH (DUF465 family)